MELAPPAYYTAKLTLTAQSQNYNLLTLIHAIPSLATAPGCANQVFLRGSAGIQVGDGTLSATNEGDNIPAAVSKVYGPYRTCSFPLANLFMRCNTAAGTTVDVEVVCCE